MPDQILHVALTLVTMILSLTVHEYAHARAAWALGDDTASREGRLTLSPIPHIDPLGSLLLPAMSAFMGGIPFIGWARPVPFNPLRFNRRVTMRSGTALVAAAGPASNVILAVLATVALRFLPLEGSYGDAAQVFLYTLVQLNLGLAIFNLIPVPPLDGSKLLPRSMDGLVELLARYSFFFFLLILISPVGRWIGFLVRGAVSLLFGAVGMA